MVLLAFVWIITLPILLAIDKCCTCGAQIAPYVDTLLIQVMCSIIVAGEVTRAYVVHVPASYSPANSEAAALVLDYNNDNNSNNNNNDTGGGLPRLDPQRGHQHGPRALGPAGRHRGRG